MRHQGKDIQWFAAPFGSFFREETAKDGAERRGNDACSILDKDARFLQLDAVVDIAQNRNKQTDEHNAACKDETVEQKRSPLANERIRRAKHLQLRRRSQTSMEVTL